HWFVFRFGCALGQTHSLPSLGFSVGLSGLAMCVTVKGWHNSNTFIFFFPFSILFLVKTHKRQCTLHHFYALLPEYGLASICFHRLSRHNCEPCKIQLNKGQLLLYLPLAY